MLALKDQCMHPSTNKPYLKTSVGGKDNSPEGIQVGIPNHSPFQRRPVLDFYLLNFWILKHGITHGFVVEFENIEDRDYYVTTDPVHQRFVKSIGEVVEKAQVIDFTPDIY